MIEELQLIGAQVDAKEDNGETTLNVSLLNDKLEVSVFLLKIYNNKLMKLNEQEQ